MKENEFKQERELKREGARVKIGKLKVKECLRERESSRERELE